MGPRAGLDGGKSRPAGIRSPDRPSRSQSLYRLSYPAHYIKVQVIKRIHLTGFPSSNEIMPHHKAQECDATETRGTIIDLSHVTEHCGVNWLTQNSHALAAHLLYAGVCHITPNTPRNKSVSVTMMQNEIKTFRARISRQHDYSALSFAPFSCKLSVRASKYNTILRNKLIY